MSGRGQWLRWLAASGLLHALLLGGLVLAVGPAARPPALLRARLVAEVKPLAIRPLEKERPAVQEVLPATPAPAPRGKQTRTAVAPALRGHSSRASAARPGPMVETGGEVPAVAIAPPPPVARAKEEGAPAGPIGGGQARLDVPRLGGPAPEAGRAPLEANAAPVVPPVQSDPGVQGIFLVPAGTGSRTGHSGIAAADHGVGLGGGGGGSGGAGRGGPGSLGGTGAGVIASRGGTGGPGGGEGTGGSGGAGLSALLRSIRTRIEEARIYPEEARRDGIQGTVELRFRIASDGSVEAVEILRSSGSRLLDEASEQTIRRAAPYPVVPGWLRLPLSYRLDQ